MISREEAINFLKTMPQLDSDMNHYLETEAIMVGLARKFNEDEGYWGMLGLLHDIDWSQTKTNLKEHGIKAREMLEHLGFEPEFIEIIQSHTFGYEEIPAFKDKKRSKEIEHCLAAAETLTGIIYAYALMRGKKISDMEPKGLKKKFDNRTFAANCNREIIKEIELTSLKLDELFSIAIESMKRIKAQIGLE
jgi:putative nucleotidyltransferase with HDIG domain